MTVEDKTTEKAADESSSNNHDEESTLEKLPYPKSVFFIVSNEFCERFCYYGMRTILILYLTDILTYSESDAKVIYHAFTMFVYFFPVLGAILSDSFLGKFRTILYLSMVYAAGSVLLSLTAIDPLYIPKRSITIVALLLIALGTGGIKPCVAAFGGDQFILPQQEIQLAMFFSLFYFAINSGSLISTFLTPILRNDVNCFDNNSCYPLAFAIPGILMVISIFIFAFGRPMYRIKKPKGNVFVNVVKCMSYAITHRKTSGPVDHWLDRSESKYGAHLVNDIKSLLKVLVIYIPIPVFWALYDQQGSGWTFQAVRMDGNIGIYTILPDQMQVINPLLILVFIPLFTYVVYPAFAKCNMLKTPLQRMVCGGFLAAVAFAISAVLSIVLENTYPIEPEAGHAQVRVYDTTNCDYSFNTTDNVVPDGILTNGYYVYRDIQVDGSTTIQFTFTPSNTTCNSKSYSLTVSEQTAYGIYLTDSDDAKAFVDSVVKSSDGYPYLRTLTNDDSSLTYTYTKKNKTFTSSSELEKLDYIGDFTINGLANSAVELKLGGTYTVLVNHESGTIRTQTVVEPNSIHMLWLLIQYTVITAAEIMFSITGLEFAYSQAPISMKSVVQAMWLLTTAIGNLIIVVIEAIEPFEKQSNNFFLYTGLMVADILLFMWLAIRYKYVTDEDSSIIVVDETELEKNGVDNPGFDKNNKD